MVTPQGIPISFDLTPVHGLTQRLPRRVTAYGDEAWINSETGIALISRRRKDMTPTTAEEREGLRRYRGRVEAVKSQLAAWGIQRLHARTHEGWAIKVLASLFALPVRQRQLAIRVTLSPLLCSLFGSVANHFIIVE